MLRVAARFPTYSPSNVLLIAAQRPDATRVGGIRMWNSLGRHVNKGEHGIAILAPCVYRRNEEAPGDSQTAADGSATADVELAGVRVLRGFRVVHVFDVSQTDGDPLPDAAPTLLEGEAPPGLWDHLAALVQDSGYALARGVCPSGVNGYTDPHSRQVRVRDDVAPAQAVKTLAHEVAHIRADHAGRFPTYGSDVRCRGRAEIEAESIAYIVTANAGMSSDAYSVPYVGAWADGDTARIRDCATHVVTVARSLLPGAKGGSPVRATTASSTIDLLHPRSVGPERTTS
jgi:antirestriction protein ArdC